MVKKIKIIGQRRSRPFSKRCVPETPTNVGEKIFAFRGHQFKNVISYTQFRTEVENLIVRMFSCFFFSSSETRSARITGDFFLWSCEPPIRPREAVRFTSTRATSMPVSCTSNRSLRRSTSPTAIVPLATTYKTLFYIVIKCLLFFLSLSCF